MLLCHLFLVLSSQLFSFSVSDFSQILIFSFTYSVESRRARRAHTCSCVASSTWLPMYHNLSRFSSWVLSLPTEISPGGQNCFEGCYLMTLTQTDCQGVEWLCFPFPDIYRGVCRVWIHDLLTVDTNMVY